MSLVHWYPTPYISANMGHGAGIIWLSSICQDHGVQALWRGVGEGDCVYWQLFQQHRNTKQPFSQHISTFWNKREEYNYPFRIIWLYFFFWLKVPTYSQILTLWKVTSKEDNLNGRRAQRKTTYQEDNLTGRWSHMKKTSQEEQEKGPTGRWP